jgi:hypothetical protein
MEDGTLLMVEGSTGGAGLRGLQGEEPTPLTCTVLYLDPDTGALRAYDEITLGGLGETEVTIQRFVVPEAEGGTVAEQTPAPATSTTSPTTAPPATSPPTTSTTTSPPTTTSPAG